jgi:hypothetical protein
MSVAPNRYGLLRISSVGIAPGSATKPANIVYRASTLVTNMARLPAWNRLFGRFFIVAIPAVRPQLPSQKQRNSRGQNSFRIDLAHQRRFAMPVTEMKDHVYKILELVGSSEKSIEDAIQNAITRASKTIREMKWFEVVQTRGHIEKGSVRHYQVTLRVGFTLEE